MINKYLTRVQGYAPHRGLLVTASSSVILSSSLTPPSHFYNSLNIWLCRFLCFQQNTRYIAHKKNLDQGGGVGGGQKTSTASAPTFLSSTSVLSSAVGAASPGVSTPGSAAAGGCISPGRCCCVGQRGSSCCCKTPHFLSLQVNWCN
jgi:hypothetical protein